MSELDASEFRRILGHWGSGVAVVATRKRGDRLCGLTVNAFASVSLDPPLVLVCVERNADSHDCIRAAGFFSVNVLSSDQERVARRFANWEVDTKFEGLGFRIEATGAPILDDALAWVDCRIWAEYEGGDHTIFIGEVVAGDAREDAPLLFYRGGYGRLVP
ncbi:MAG: flavin reductase family protein [Gemmatimonadota bacterium]